MKLMKGKSDKFFSVLSKKEIEIFSALKTPNKIQEYLDNIKYSEDSRYRCPRNVIKDEKAHCYDGAVFASAALRFIGYPPVILDMIAYRDDDHLIAVFKRNGFFGAVAKSNFTGLRYREPIYKNIRELVMSYFDSYYNLDKQKSLREYIPPLNLKLFDKYNWLIDDSGMDKIEKKLNNSKTIKVLTPGMIKFLSPVDERTFKAGMLGANMAGIYDPKSEK